MAGSFQAARSEKRTLVYAAAEVAETQDPLFWAALSLVSFGRSFRCNEENIPISTACNLPPGALFQRL